MENKNVHAEEWRSVAGFENIYEVSNLGRIRRIDGAKYSRESPIKTPYPTTGGYLALVLFKNGTRTSPQPIHRLVATAFHGPCPPGRECAHIDGDKLNCSAANLLWATHKENISHKYVHGTQQFGDTTYNHKLSSQDIPEIIKLSRGGVKTSEIADRFDVTRATIWRVLNGVTWVRASAGV